MNQNNTPDYFDSIMGVANNSPKKQMDYFDTVLANIGNTQRDISDLGARYAEQFNSQIDKWKNVGGEEKYRAFTDYSNTLNSDLVANGYTPTQIQKVMSDFSAKANPAERSSKIDYYVKDPLRRALGGGTHLAANVINAFDTENAVKDWLENYSQGVNRELSDRTQINNMLAEQQYQRDLDNGMNESFATAKMYFQNPMKGLGDFAEQTPQIALALATRGAAIGPVNTAASAGSYRGAIKDAYERALKDNPEHLKTLPNIQARLEKGMTLEEAVEEAKNDFSDHWEGIVRAGVIGGIESLLPLGKIGKGTNKGVLSTLGKEILGQAGQEGAEQLNENYGVGQVDGQTGLMDNVQRSATTGALMGLGMGVPAAIDAHSNRKTQEKSDQTLMMFRQV